MNDMSNAILSESRSSGIGGDWHHLPPAKSR